MSELPWPAGADRPPGLPGSTGPDRHPGDSGPARTGLSRRQVLTASGTGLLAATASAVPASAATGSTVLKRPAASGSGDGTPEQIHLTWGDDPATSVVVSWGSPRRSARPRVRIGQRVIAAEERAYAGPGGETVWTYHARVAGLRPGATYGYAVTSDNDRSAADPFSATFTTAPEGRSPFRFTSFGDLAAPAVSASKGAWTLSNRQAAYAAGAVEQFQPLFHLLNGDLCHADLNPAVQPQVWRDVANTNQASAANRPWMPALGSREAGFYDEFSPYLTRYTLPDNGLPAFTGRWYAFRIGSALFVSLDANDVIHGYSRGMQTRWLAQTLEAARRDTSVDWIVVQAHQRACTSSLDGDGISTEWLQLFDNYEVDLVLAGHGRGYERSFPVRGLDRPAGPAAVAGMYRPHPVTTADSGVFDTSQGTVHLALGRGGTPDADGVARPAWSARRDTSAGYGIAVFDVDPGTEADGQTSITVTHYRPAAADPAPGLSAVSPSVPEGDYTQFETFTLVRPRSDRRRWHARENSAIWA